MLEVSFHNWPLVLKPRQTVNPTGMSPQTLQQMTEIWHMVLSYSFSRSLNFSPSLLCFCARPQVFQCTLYFFSCCISAETEGQTSNVSTWPGLSTVIVVFGLAVRNDLIMTTARYLHLLLKRFENRRIIEQSQPSPLRLQRGEQSYALFAPTES